jgi:hypothetical protein
VGEVRAAETGAKRRSFYLQLRFQNSGDTFKQVDASEAPRPTKPKLTRAYIEQHALPGESWEDATERLRRKLEVRDS